MAPPMMPPAIAAPSARWALAGVAVSAQATVAAARSAANVFFMSRTLLEMRRLSAPGGIKIDSERQAWNLPCRQRSAQWSTQSKRLKEIGPKNAFFQANIQRRL